MKLQADVHAFVERVEKAVAPGRKRIPGDGDGDGIPYESRNRKKGGGGTAPQGGPQPPKLTSIPGATTRQQQQLDQAVLDHKAGNTDKLKDLQFKAKGMADMFGQRGGTKAEKALADNYRAIHTFTTDALAHLANSAPVRSSNEGYGFHHAAMSSHRSATHGTDGNYVTEAHYKAGLDAADAAFSRAAHDLVNAKHFPDTKAAAEFLDSRMGRHVGDMAGHNTSVTSVPWLASAVKEHKRGTK
jgi:hypothetical protein